MRTPTYFLRAPTARSTRPRREDETASPAHELPSSPLSAASLFDRTRQDRIMSLKSAATFENVLDELQATLAHGTVAHRVETLRRVTDLFVSGAVDFSAHQIGLFDDVFQC